MKEASLEDLVNQCTSQQVTVRVPAYRTLTQKCTGETEKVIWSDFASLDDTHKTLINIKTDLLSETVETSYEAAGVCGCLLANDSFLSLVNSEDEVDILDALIKSIKDSKEKKILTRCLWSLSKSKLKRELFLEKFEQILETINGILRVENASSVAVHEALQVIQSLLEIVPNEMGKEAKNWFPCVFGYMFNDVNRIRTAAFATVNGAKVIFEKMENFSDIRSDILKMIIPDLKAHNCKRMNRLVTEDCTDILKEWKMIVQFLGKELHPGTSLINGLLEVVEKGFKSSKPEIRVDAFNCWRALIDNFSLDDSVLTHSKRLKLLLAPLKANNAKTEDIAYAKLLAWWHLVCKLGKKASINFDMIVVPLLRFCFGCGSSSGGAAVGLAERNLIMSGAAASPGRKFANLHVACAEILAQIIFVGINIPGVQTYNFSMLQMEEPLLNNPALFVRHHNLLLNCISEAAQSLNFKDCKQNLLGILLFQSILAHTRVAINLDSNKKDSVEIVKELFNTLSVLEKNCCPEDSQSQFVFKFYELVTVGNLALPKTVLNSRHYHTATMRDMMSGTLSNHLICQLCKPSILHFAPIKPGFFSMWLVVLSNSKPSTGKLGFLQFVMKELDSAAAILCPANPSTLVHMWSAVVHQLIEYIKETQIIDQGDGSEHDWSCIYSILLFPLIHSIDALSSADHHVYQEIMKDWNELWCKFTELTPLSPTAEPNSEVEHVACALVNICTEKLTAPPDIHAAAYSLMADVLATLTEKLRYSELGKTSVRLVHSPAKPKKRTHPLHNLASCIELFRILFQKVIRIVSSQRQHAASKLCEAIIHVFGGIQQTKLVDLLIAQVIDPLCDLLKVNPAARFNSEVEKRFIAMFKSFGTLLETHFGTKHSADLLNKVAPLFLISLKSTNKHIKQEAHKIWKSCFSSTSFSIPGNLFDVLKECGLPPASLTELNGSMEDSICLSPKENHLAQVGTHKLKSLKVDSPVSGRWSRDATVTKEKSKPKTKLEDMKDEDFVKIISPSSKKRVLTEHQIERMSERRSDIPALYSELSQAVSQDLLPSHFASQNSFEESSAIDMKGSPFKKPDKNKSSSIDLEVSARGSKGENSTDDQPGVEELSFSGKFATENSGNQPSVKNEESCREKLDENQRNKPERGSQYKNITGKPLNKTDGGGQGMCKTEESEVNSKIPLGSSGSNKLESVSAVGILDSAEGEESNILNTESPKRKINEKFNFAEVTDSEINLEIPSNKSEKHEKISVSDKDVLASKTDTFRTYSNKKKKESTLRRYGSGDSDYTDEDLNEELRRTSLELQKSLNSCSAESDKKLKLREFRHRKAQVPVKKSLRDIRKSFKRTGSSITTTLDTGKIDSPRSQRQMQEHRINFKQVAVSPSVIQDHKIVKQIPEVKLTDGALLVKHVISKCVSDTDSEDEIPNSQVNGVTDSFMSFSKREATVSSCKSRSVEGVMESNTSTRLIKAKRKRNLPEECDLAVNLDKKQKVEEITGQMPVEKRSSSEDSVVLIEENIEEQQQDQRIGGQRKGKENQKQQIVSEEMPGKNSRKMPTRKNSQNSSDSQSNFDRSEGTSSYCTPTKVTRSGRKVVAPNRDMPEPMTPPGSSSSKKKKSSQDLLVVSYVGDCVPKVTEALSSQESIYPKKSVQKKITDMFSKNDKKIFEVEASDDSEDGDALPEMDDINDSQLYDEDKDDYAPKKDESTSSDIDGDTDIDQSVHAVQRNVSTPTVAQKSEQSSSTKEPLKDNVVLSNEGKNNESVIDVDSESNSADCKNKETIECDKSLKKSFSYSKVRETKAHTSTEIDNENNAVPPTNDRSEISDVEMGENCEPHRAMEPQELMSENVLPVVETKIKGVMQEKVDSLSEESSSFECGQAVDEQLNEIPEKYNARVIDCNADKSGDAKSVECIRESEMINGSHSTHQQDFGKAMNLEELCSEKVIEASVNTYSDVYIEKNSEDCVKTSQKLSGKSSEISSKDLKKPSSEKDNYSKNSHVTCVGDSEKGVNEMENSGKILVNDSENSNNDELQKVGSNMDSSNKGFGKMLVEFSLTARQQEEELSPEKPCMSRLHSAVSTPERQKKKGTFKYAGSRAAMLVACAKQNIRNRGTNEGESPSKCGGDASRHRHSGSPYRRSTPGRFSPSTPPSRKRKICDSDSDRPWMKHEPSPGASPSPSILKKATLDDSINRETPSPPPAKYRRVSFADPPVSDRVEIPPSPKTLKSIRAQKRLDMTNVSSPVKDIDFPSPSKESQEADSPTSVNCSQPLYPSLINCQEKVDKVAHQLTSPALVEGLMSILGELGVHTVGQLSHLTEADVNKLPVRAPKIAATIKILKKYEETELKEGKTSSESVLDDVEAQLSEIFGEVDREDKENQQPNNQVHLLESGKSADNNLENEETSENRESNRVDILGMDEDVTPLDTLLDDLNPGIIKSVCTRANENPAFLESLVDHLDADAKESLFSILIDKLQYSFLIDCFHHYLKSRNTAEDT
ncbi:hypothetical protein OTU49_010733 [Cherax quadricarinatus]|uniref:Telomere-associated protein Rif1 N-terminal domain-containing protein n=3 Tax=Cherax quadricarinatus TaxID=27406 RepID=A0AAW0W6V8_CHEQU|nr:telomere-associated protein RIF1-like isoform X2 [Cherax quadricarinatus]XP_053652144.1 telomere-associated protein RIF1-like isoform X2 [Cherax quadricarinatus]XP_053652145.1 telomere-associated protein RIF1-like isoform X2 [Cherax quadricarinatus]